MRGMQLDLIDRPFTPDDLDALLELERQSGPSGWTRSQLYWFLRRPRVSFHVIALRTAPEKSIGFFVLASAERHAYLANLAVDPAFKRMGVASFALEQVVRIARHRKLQTLILDVQEANLPAQLLYRKHGYRAEEILHEHYTDQDGYRMVKRLRPLAPTV